MDGDTIPKATRVRDGHREGGGQDTALLERARMLIGQRSFVTKIQVSLMNPNLR